MSADPMCKCGRPESKHGRHGCPFVPASLTWSDKDGPLISASPTATPEPASQAVSEKADPKTIPETSLNEKGAIVAPVNPSNS